MDTFQLYQRLALALAIGLLIGIERGWREREGRAGSRAAGIRTHALIGLLGGVWGLISQFTSADVLGFATLGFASTFAFFEWRENKIAKSSSATGLVAGLLAFALGAYAVLGDMILAGSAAVAATVILAERDALHGFLEKMKWVELRSALLLLVMTVILLPLLPGSHNRSMAGAQPISDLDDGGGDGRGFLWWIHRRPSAWWTQWAFVCRLRRRTDNIHDRHIRLRTDLREHPDASWELMSGTAAAWAVSLVRMTAIALIFAPSLTQFLVGPIAAAVAVIALAAGFF